jgi:hypothetical protein
VALATSHRLADGMMTLVLPRTEPPMKINTVIFSTDTGIKHFISQRSYFERGFYNDNKHDWAAKHGNHVNKHTE